METVRATSCRRNSQFDITHQTLPWRLESCWHSLAWIELIRTTWWNGTSFLYLPESAWPEIRPTQHESDVVLQEAVKSPPSVTHALVITLTAPPEKRIDQVIDVNQFSDLTKLLRATALVLTFVRKVKNRAREIKFLLNSKIKVTPPNYVSQFRLFLDNGIVKLQRKGRHNNSNPPSNSRNPILLPAKHQFVRLVIKDMHELTKHSGNLLFETLL